MLHYLLHVICKPIHFQISVCFCFSGLLRAVFGSGGQHRLWEDHDSGHPAGPELGPGPLGLVPRESAPLRIVGGPAAEHRGDPSLVLARSGAGGPHPGGDPELLRLRCSRALRPPHPHPRRGVHGGGAAHPGSAGAHVWAVGAGSHAGAAHLWRIPDGPRSGGVPGEGGRTAGGGEEVPRPLPRDQ